MNDNMVYAKLQNVLLENKNAEDAAFLQRFFKTGPGEYGEGDLFLGIRNPQTRAIAKQFYKQTTIEDMDALLRSKWHEVRLCGLVIMTLRYKKADNAEKQQTYELYLQHIGKGINNWDLVDVSAPRIIGRHIYDKELQDI